MYIYILHVTSQVLLIIFCKRLDKLRDKQPFGVHVYTRTFSAKVKGAATGAINLVVLEPTNPLSSHCLSDKNSVWGGYG